MKHQAPGTLTGKTLKYFFDYVPEFTSSFDPETD